MRTIIRAAPLCAALCLLPLAGCSTPPPPRYVQHLLVAHRTQTVQFSQAQKRQLRCPPPSATVVRAYKAAVKAKATYAQLNDVLIWFGPNYGTCAGNMDRVLDMKIRAPAPST